MESVRHREIAFDNVKFSREFNGRGREVFLIMQHCLGRLIMAINGHEQSMQLNIL
jgi:stringent starvation protein B